MHCTLSAIAIWDILYEHCSYFTPVSLAHTFSSCGFSVCELTEQFDGQFLSLEALPTEGVVDETDEQLGKSSSSSDITSFAANFQNKVKSWRSELEQIKGKGSVPSSEGSRFEGSYLLECAQYPRSD